MHIGYSDWICISGMYTRCACLKCMWIRMSDTQFRCAYQICISYLSYQRYFSDMQIRYADRICISDIHMRYAYRKCISDVQISYMRIKYASQTCRSNMQSVRCVVLCVFVSTLIKCCTSDTSRKVRLV